MAAFLSKTVADPQSTQGVDLASRGRELQTVVDKYTESFPARLMLNGSTLPLPSGDVYLLTGTTGGLGSNMLAQLLEVPTVTRIYAFNRPSKSATSEMRQLTAFRQRGLNTDLLSYGKLVYVEGDLSEPSFSLDDKQYGEVSRVTSAARCPLTSWLQIHRSVTHIIHNGT
jgi:Male sterility protein